MINFPKRPITTDDMPSKYGIKIGDKMMYKSLFCWLHEKAAAKKYSGGKSAEARMLVRYFADSENIPAYDTFYYKSGAKYEELMANYIAFVKLFNNNPYRRCVGMYFDSGAKDSGIELTEALEDEEGSIVMSSPLDSIFSSDLEFYFVKCENTFDGSFDVMPLGFIFDYCGDLLSDKEKQLLRQALADDAREECKLLPKIDTELIKKAQTGINTLLVGNKYADCDTIQEAARKRKKKALDTPEGDPDDEDYQPLIDAEDENYVHKSDCESVTINGLNGDTDSITAGKYAMFFLSSFLALVDSAIITLSVAVMCYCLNFASVGLFALVTLAACLLFFTFTIFKNTYRFGLLYSVLNPFVKSKRRILQLLRKPVDLPVVKVAPDENGEYLLENMAREYGKKPYLTDYRNLFRSYSKALYRSGSGRVFYRYSVSVWFFIVSAIFAVTAVIIAVNGGEGPAKTFADAFRSMF